MNSHKWRRSTIPGPAAMAAIIETFGSSLQWNPRFPGVVSRLAFVPVQTRSSYDRPSVRLSTEMSEQHRDGKG